MNRKIRVLVCDDHALFRAGVKTVLAGAGDIEVVGEAANGIEAGMRYASSIRNRRVRVATALPGLIGARTLALLRAAGATGLQRHIKVPRREVRAIVGSLIFSFGARSQIESLHRELSR